jgi:hypothetical protein
LGHSSSATEYFNMILPPARFIFTSAFT